MPRYPPPFVIAVWLALFTDSQFMHEVCWDRTEWQLGSSCTQCWSAIVTNNHPISRYHQYNDWHGCIPCSPISPCPWRILALSWGELLPQHAFSPCFSGASQPHLIPDISKRSNTCIKFPQLVNPTENCGLMSVVSLDLPQSLCFPRASHLILSVPSCRVDNLLWQKG